MKTHYSNFDVLAEKNQWDENSRNVVEKRLEKTQCQVLSTAEVTVLVDVCRGLLGDGRESIMDFVIGHFDNKLTSKAGQGQRKSHLPAFPRLLQGGIEAFNLYVASVAGQPFDQLSEQQQAQILADVMQTNPAFKIDAMQVGAMDFLAAVHSEAVSAYYSHPLVWSEIGYAGPAYPRGYVRTERGLRDPWEAKRQDG